MQWHTFQRLQVPDVAIQIHLTECSVHDDRAYDYALAVDLLQLRCDPDVLLLGWQVFDRLVEAFALHPGPRIPQLVFGCKEPLRSDCRIRFHLPHGGVVERLGPTIVFHAVEDVTRGQKILPLLDLVEVLQ